MGYWRLSAAATAVENVLAGMAPAARGVVELALAPQLRVELRRARRRAAVAAAAQLLRDDGCNDPWPLCGRLHAALSAYGSARWRFERGGPAPTTLDRAGLHAVMTETDGRVLSQRQLYRLLVTDTFCAGNVSAQRRINHKVESE